MTRSGLRQKDDLTTALTTAGAIEINRPVQRVFDFVTDMTNDALWRSDISSLTAVDDTPLSVGKVFMKSRANTPPRVGEWRVRLAFLSKSTVPREFRSA